MVDYESLARNRPSADALRLRIAQQIQRGRTAYEGRLPNDRELEALEEQCLPTRTLQTGVSADDASWEDLTERRKTSEYWRKHCQTVGFMMNRLARLLKQDEHLWRVTGLVHDYDFLTWPHYDEKTAPDKAHPTALSTELLEMGFPLVLVLAVLEHSPHLQQPPSSPLSHALILCDEHATMTGAGQIPVYDDEADEIIACLERGQKITGYWRDDMQTRAQRAITPLVGILKSAEKSQFATAFSLGGWTL